MECNLRARRGTSTRVAMRLGRLGIQQQRSEQAPAAGAGGELQLLRTLRRAAAALTPVAFDPGPQRPRLGSFVEAVEGKGAASALFLHPVCVDAIPRAPAPTVIRSCDPADAWIVTAGPLAPAGARRARVDLRGAVI